MISLALGLGQLARAQADSLVTGVRDTSRHQLSVPSYMLTGKILSGRAGMYSSKADGSMTANGETFSNNALTAGCNRFPFLTWIKVTNPKNGKWVLVRVNDRVPKKSKSLLELSRAAVKKLGFLKQGYATVKVQKITINDSLSIYKLLNDTASQQLTAEAGLPDDTPPFEKSGHAVSGIASFYSANLDGTLTATGERYRNNKLTAASNFFKLNTWVLVTNLHNHKQVIVRINDRMHPRMKKRGRVVDLSLTAAKHLDFIKAGLTRVKVEPIVWEPADSTDNPAAPIADSTRPIIASDTATAAADSTNDTHLVNEADPESLTGTASYLNAAWEGRTTASGEKFKQNSMMAASSSFPLGTWVRVKRISTGKTVVVKIVDQISDGARKKGRIVFLSRKAAGKLGILSAGIVKVAVEKADPGNLD